MSKPRILLLHGALGSKTQFNPLKNHLNSAFDILTLNFYGHGGSTITEEFSIELFTNQTRWFLQEHELSNIDIFGYSMGGYVALNLAEKHPELVNRIFTVATKFNWTQESAKLEVKMLQPDVIEEKIPKFAQALEKRHAPVDWKENMQQTAKMMLSLAADNVLTPVKCANIDSETLVAVGSNDNMVTQEETKLLAASLKNGSFQVLNNFPHPIEQMDTDILAKQIINYFS